MPSERDLLEETALRLGEQAEYPSFADITKKMTLDKLIEYVNLISTVKVPTNFSTAKIKQGYTDDLVIYG